MKVMLRRACIVSLAVTAYAAVLNAAPLPKTTGESLSGHEVTLPAATVGHLAVLVIGFSHSSSKPIEQWDKAIGARTSAQSVPVYNIAVIQDAPRFVRGMITHSMKAMVPAAGHDHFLTVVQGEEELKRAVDFSAHDDAYVLVINSDGDIIFKTHGDPVESLVNQVLAQIKTS